MAVIGVTVTTSSSGDTADGSSTAPAPPRLPCPSSGQSVDTKALTAPASTSPGVTWAGVFERIFVSTNMDGSVSKTPHQHTLVAATGQGTATVNVPMASSSVHRRSRGKKATVENGVAHVTLNLKHKTSERLDADYTRPLPVTVTVSYKLNGQPIAGNDIKGKSGAVEVDYQLTNATAKPVQVCFKGFNGKVIKQTVTEVAPIYAYMSLTLPKHVSQFTAPGAFENAARTGVSTQWLVALFQPLGPTQQTLKLTMTTSKAKIPKATLLLELVQPEALTGSAPAASAEAVGRAQASAAAAAGKVQADVAALEVKAGQPHQSHHSSGRGRSRSGRSTGGGRPTLSFGTSTAALAEMQSRIGTVGQTAMTHFSNVNLTARRLTGSADQSINTLAASAANSVDSLTANATRSIDGLAASTTRSIDGLTTSARRSMGRLASDLHRAVDRGSVNDIAARAGHLQTMAVSLGTAAGNLVHLVAGLAGRVQNLVAALPAPVADALRLYLLLNAVGRDLDAFPAAVKVTAEFLKLKADVTAGQVLAKTVSDSMGRVQVQTREVLGEVDTLQHDVLSLQTKIGALVTATVKNAEDTTQAAVSDSVRGLDARFAADIASAQTGVDGFGKTAQARVAAAETSAHDSVAGANQKAHRAVTSASARAQQSLAQALSSAKQRVAAVQIKVSQILASVNAKAQAALASAKAKAKQGGQATLAAAQAAAAKSEAAAQSALTKANDDYAHLLAINQQAVAWQLPGGDATNVSEQEGSLIYTIAGS